MDAKLLCKLDDLMKILIIKPLHPGVRMMMEESKSTQIKVFEKWWIKDYVLKILDKEQDDIVSLLLKIIQEFQLTKVFNISNEKHVQLYLRLYINFFKNESISMQNCYTYSLENYRGVKVIANCDIEKNMIIQGVFGMYKVLTDKHKSELQDDQQFSILTNSSRKSFVLLGTIAYINHHCNPNCEYVSADKSYVKLRSLRKIKNGEELFVYYGDNYFENDNKNCECSACKPIAAIKTSSDKSPSQDDQIDDLMMFDTTQEASFESGSTLEAEFLGFENSTIHEDISFKSKLYQNENKRTNENQQTEKVLQVILTRVSLDYKKSTKDNYNNATLKRKKPFCPFCKQFQSQFAKHVRKMHDNKPDVKKLLKCKDEGKKNAILSNLRSKGYATYHELTGIVIPVKNPKKSAKKNVEKVQCPECQGYYSKSTIWKHKQIHQRYRV